MYKLFWSFWAILMFSMALLMCGQCINHVRDKSLKGSSAYSLSMMIFLWSGLSSVNLINKK